MEHTRDSTPHTASLKDRALFMVILHKRVSNSCWQADSNPCFHSTTNEAQPTQAKYSCSLKSEWSCTSYYHQENTQIPGEQSMNLFLMHPSPSPKIWPWLHPYTLVAQKGNDLDILAPYYQRKITAFTDYMIPAVKDIFALAEHRSPFNKSSHHSTAPS